MKEVLNRGAVIAIDIGTTTALISIALGLKCFMYYLDKKQQRG